ncbi:hypothetical protein [Streptomyces sp. RerS4]|uniref:hypothetical protein n=1 Tax=Streptomyces sp. RerS4 TaxID=2942449 RepID=UPI00201C426D|nr:hypothetical protein [Streptomyces sp. RerS4]UQW99402.1 hypothetical protein M4D82_01805 [Streptomyces sp. RerS4]
MGGSVVLGKGFAAAGITGGWRLRLLDVVGRVPVAADLRCRRAARRPPPMPTRARTRPAPPSTARPLFLSDRFPADSLRIDGDPGLLYLLRAWEPEEWGRRFT